MTSSYAGCGCTALTPSYAGPSFVPSHARGFGAEGAKEEMSDRARYIGMGLCVVFIYLVHKASGGFAPPPVYKTPRSTAPPRQYYLPR